MAGKQYRPWAPTQSFLLPPSPQEWLPTGHLAYFILEVVSTIDLTEIEASVQSGDARGERPYSPAMMLALLVYGYCVGVFSSRKIARATYEDVAFRVIAGGCQPHFTTINQFRLDHLHALKGLFVQVLLLCKRAGLVKLGHVSLDGTKIKASASKHKAMSYERMTKEERQILAEVKALLERAARADEEEDKRYGRGQEPADLPAELQRREDRLARIRKAKQELEEEAARARAETLRANAEGQWEKAADKSVDAAERERAARRARKSEDKARDLDGNDGDGPSAGADDTGALPHHRVAANPDGTPKPSAQRNFTDPDSRIMVTGGTFIQGYNAQIVVDDAHQVILAEAVTNQPTDPDHLPAMVDRTIENCGRAPAVMTADSGYYSEANALYLEQRRIDGYLAVGRENPEGPPEITEASTPAQQAKRKMSDKVRSIEGRKLYARRKVIVEPPFGQMKEARGFRRFSLRGVGKARPEWTLVCLTHNLLKLFRAMTSGVAGHRLPSPAIG